MFSRVKHFAYNCQESKNKLGNILPQVDFILGETILLLDNACNMNKEFDNCRTIFDCPLSRHWGNIRGLAKRW